MECVFRGLDTKKCFSQQKCAGIENLILQMGGSQSFALGFARYAFRTSFLNKIKDNMFETLYKYTINPLSIQLKAKFLLYKLIDKISTWMIGNPYSIQNRFTEIEVRVKDWLWSWGRKTLSHVWPEQLFVYRIHS